MENAELYRIYNTMQRKDTEDVLAEFGPNLEWSDNEKVLDIGSGPGDVTAEVLLPYLPNTASLVGVDLSLKMVEYANKKFACNNLHFKTLDFSTKNITDFFPEQYFSKIFSFYCLHWIQDQQQVAKNIYTLLKPGGYFLLLLAPTSSVFKVYKILSQMDKWKVYMKDVDAFIPSLYSSSNACQDIQQHLTSQGLEVTLCEERKHMVSFPNMRTLMRSTEAVNPFVIRMNKDTREQYMSCFEKLVAENQLCTETVSGEVLTLNPLIIVSGQRPQASPP